MNLQIIKAEENDFLYIGSLHYDSWYKTYLPIMSNQFLEYNTKEKLILAAKHKIKDTYIAKLDNKIIGYLYYLTSEEIIEIKELYILEEYQGKKIGKKLLEYLYRANPIIKRYNLWVIQKNHNAINFYEKMGFENSGIINEISINNNQSFIEILYSKII